MSAARAGALTEAGDGVYVLECDAAETALGPVLHLQLERYDDQPMGWAELYAAFIRRYPGRWAVQVFPPRSELLDGANKYHLWLLSRPPEGMTL